MGLVESGMATTRASPLIPTETASRSPLRHAPAMPYGLCAGIPLERAEIYGHPRQPAGVPMSDGPHAVCRSADSELRYARKAARTEMNAAPPKAPYRCACGTTLPPRSLVSPGRAPAYNVQPITAVMPNSNAPA